MLTSLPYQSRFPYPCLRALSSKMRESRKRGETISTLDHDNSGLVDFKIDPSDHERSLQILQRCRKKIIGLVDFDGSSTSTARPPETGGQYLEDLILDRIDRIQNHIFPAFRSCPIADLGIRGDHLALFPLATTGEPGLGLLLSHHGQHCVEVDFNTMRCVLYFHLCYSNQVYTDARKATCTV